MQIVDADWGRTPMALRRLEDRLGSDGTFQGRPVIHRDSPIDGGAYVGAYEREAIVVDSQKDPEIIRLYTLAQQKATLGGRIHRSAVLNAVYNTVTDAFPVQDDEAVEALVDELGVRNDKEVALGVFIRRGIGTCRHTGLAAAVLLELFKMDGYVRGQVSADRNTTPEGAHGWARYTSHDGTIFIIDVRRKFCGTLEQAVREGKWPYQRPEDAKYLEMRV